VVNDGRINMKRSRVHFDIQGSAIGSLALALVAAGCLGGDETPSSVPTASADDPAGGQAQRLRPLEAAAQPHDPFVDPIRGQRARSSVAPAAGVKPEVINALRRVGSAHVIVNLRHSMKPSELSAADFIEIGRLQQQVLRQLPQGRFTLVRRYAQLPALAGEATHIEALEALRDHPDVDSVDLDQPTTIHLSEAVPSLGADVVRTQYGLDGRGVTVAILDTGVDSDHPDLFDDIVAQHCFSQGGCAPDNTHEGGTAEDDGGHGTNVAGIITGNGTVATAGFAPKAKVVAIRVMNSSGQGLSSDWIAGLDWVLNNLSTYPVKIINMSLGTNDMYSGNCDVMQPAAAFAVQQLRSRGVAVFSSSGNQGSPSQMSAPGCIGGVISVGATYDSAMGRVPWTGTYTGSNCFDETSSPGTIACFSNVNAQTGVLAPGAVTCAAGMGGGISCMMGTSQASPAAAGVAALLVQCRPALAPSDIENILKSTGVKVTDPRSNLTLSRVDAKAAVAATCTCAGRPQGSPCDTGDFCVANATCVDGQCRGSPRDCSSVSDATHDGVCDATAQACVQRAKAQTPGKCGYGSSAWLYGVVSILHFAGRRRRKVPTGRVIEPSSS
jgi:subtilisin family serine protease